MLVLDNADDPPVLAGPGASVREGRGWLRPVTGQAGTVLVTSRDGAGATWGPWCRRLPLGMLPADQAAEVLADYARRRSGLGDEQDARALAERLGGLPLALKIAGSYLAESAAVPAAFAEPGTISTYRQYLDALQAGEFARLFPLPGTGLTQEQARSLIGATWDLTLDRLDARQMPEARHLLRLLATFADAPIPHELLLDPALLAAASPQLPGITGPQLWQTLTVLDDFGLVTLAPAGPDTALLPTVRLHPLVRDASRPPAGSRDQLENLALAALLLARATAAPETGSPDDPSKQPAWQLLTPHASQVFSELTARTDSPGEAVIVAASAVQLTAQYRAGQGYHAAAEAEYRDVLAATLPILGPDHRDTLATRHQIALEMSAQGDHAAAEAELRDVLAVELRVHGPDHRDTLATRHNIALEMSAQGDHAAAEAEYRDVLAARLRVLGPHHPETLATRHEIAMEMSKQGDHAAAEAEYRDVLAAKLPILGSDHPSTLTTRHQIAMELSGRGDYAGAEAENRGILAVELRILGPDHPSTLATRHQIAMELSGQGDYAGAEAEFRTALAGRLRVLGPDHSSTLVTQRNLEIVTKLRSDSQRGRQRR